MFKKALLGAAVGVALTAASSATAATLIVDSSGRLTGATGVDVNGTFYDVAFLDGTCQALFSGCDETSDFTFTTSADALAASAALLSQVFIDTAQGLFDTVPPATFGCSDISICIAYTPFRFNSAGSVIGADARNSVTESGDLALVTTVIPPTHDTSADTSRVWAVFSPAAAVPEPSTWAMMLLGFGAVGYAIRRRRKHTLIPQVV